MKKLSKKESKKVNGGAIAGVIISQARSSSNSSNNSSNNNSNPNGYGTARQNGPYVQVKTPSGWMTMGRGTAINYGRGN